MRIVSLLIAIAALACGGSEEEEWERDSSPPDLDPPDPEDTTTPPITRDTIEECYPAYQDLYVEASTLEDSSNCSRLIPEWTRFRDLGEGRFRVPLTFGSIPPEAYDNWEASADLLDHVQDYGYMLEGEIPDNGSCAIAWSMRHYIQDVDGNEIYDEGGVPLPDYTPRADGQVCIAEEDYSNEGVTTFSPPLCGTFEGLDLSADVYSGTDCSDPSMGTGVAVAQMTLRQ